MNIPVFNRFNTQCVVKFLLFEFSDKYNGLLGANFLKHVNAAIDLGSQKLITPIIKTSIIYEDQCSFEFIETVPNFSYSLTIPPRSELIIKIYM